jgi:hypothetical protein
MTEPYLSIVEIFVIQGIRQMDLAFTKILRKQVADSYGEHFQPIPFLQAVSMATTLFEFGHHCYLV